MAGNCDPLYEIRDQFVEKIEEANTAIAGATEDLTVALMALAGAQAASGFCFFAGAPPAIALCAAAAVVAIGVALAAVAYYEGVLEEAQGAQQAAQNGLDEVDKLLAHCDALEEWQAEAAEDLLKDAPSADSISVPEVDDGPASDAEDALAELESYEFDSSYA